MSLRDCFPALQVADECGGCCHQAEGRCCAACSKHRQRLVGVQGSCHGARAQAFRTAPHVFWVQPARQLPMLQGQAPQQVLTLAIRNWSQIRFAHS